MSAQATATETLPVTWSMNVSFSQDLPIYAHASGRSCSFCACELESAIANEAHDRVCVSS